MNMLSFQRISRRCFGHTIFLGLKHVRRINFLHGQWGGYTLKWWVSQLMSIGIMMLGRVMGKNTSPPAGKIIQSFHPQSSPAQSCTTSPCSYQMFETINRVSIISFSFSRSRWELWLLSRVIPCGKPTSSTSGAPGPWRPSSLRLIPWVSTGF